MGNIKKRTFFHSLSPAKAASMLTDFQIFTEILIWSHPELDLTTQHFKIDWKITNWCLKTLLKLRLSKYCNYSNLWKQKIRKNVLSFFSRLLLVKTSQHSDRWQELSFRSRSHFTILACREIFTWLLLLHILDTTNFMTTWTEMRKTSSASPLLLRHISQMKSLFDLKI